MVHGFLDIDNDNWYDDDRRSRLERDFSSGDGWETRVLEYRYDPLDFEKLWYTRKTFSTEARKLLQKLIDWREDQDPGPTVSTATLRHLISPCETLNKLTHQS
jgi:hypothetical protein